MYSTSLKDAMRSSMYRTIARGVSSIAVGLTLALPAAHVFAECQLSLSDTTVDYGQQTVARRSAATADPLCVKIGSSQRTLNAVCDVDRHMAIAFHGVASGPNALQFGSEGQYTITITGAVLDGRQVALGKSPTGEVPATSGDQLALSYEDTVVPVEADAIPAGKRLELNLRIDGYVRTDAKVTREVNLEGVGHFDLVAR